MPVERIAAFIRGESEESFEELALELFRAQYRRNAALRTLCEECRVTPEAISDWREVPVLRRPEPTPDASFVDSRADLRREAIDGSFPRACLGGLGRPPTLSLIPTAHAAADPGPGLLADRVLAVWAAPDSVVAVASRGVEVARARGFLAARQRDRRPTLVLGTSATLSRLVAGLHRRGLRFRLPPGSRVVEAGVTGRDDRELLSRIGETLDLAPEGVTREYAPAGLSSRFYAGYGWRGQSRPFRPPPWARVRVLHRETLEEVPMGALGALAVFDLANPGTLAHLLTGDTGTAGESGFELAAG